MSGTAFERNWADLTPGAGGSFGVVYKGIEKATGETVAIKHVRVLSRVAGKEEIRIALLICIAKQIDLESSEDDIQEIQQEISVLSTCASSYVTQYKASFLRGHKLWIVMEYLGGGSCLDLVCPVASALRRSSWRPLLTACAAKTGRLWRSAHCHHLPGAAVGP